MGFFCPACARRGSDVPGDSSCEADLLWRAARQDVGTFASVVAKCVAQRGKAVEVRKGTAGLTSSPSPSLLTPAVFAEGTAACGLPRTVLVSQV